MRIFGDGPSTLQFLRVPRRIALACEDHSSFVDPYYSHLHFTSKETEVQRGQWPGEHCSKGQGSGVTYSRR